MITAAKCWAEDMRIRFVYPRRTEVAGRRTAEHGRKPECARHQVDRCSLQGMHAIRAAACHDQQKGWLSELTASHRLDGIKLVVQRHPLVLAIFGVVTRPQVPWVGQCTVGALGNVTWALRFRQRCLTSPNSSSIATNRIIRVLTGAREEEDHVRHSAGFTLTCRHLDRSPRAVLRSGYDIWPSTKRSCELQSNFWHLSAALTHLAPARQPQRLARML